ncbi:hypothetical protein HK097_008773, partial [Rhizophlyctis rosea]
PAPPLAEALYARRPFSSYPDLLAQTEYLISSLPSTAKLEVINAHPAIGVNKTNLSALSYAEQGYNKPGAATPNVTEDEETNQTLQRLNAEYESKFGFRFVVFVNGRPRKEIIPVLQNRMETGTKEGELETGLREMLAIARDRLKKLEPEAS